ncbi:hypothetical protein EJ110_NYTH11600 [Nymphaea thermarum]|nr:hypothetical protein EJ110_NYTH11600 [Nymphaea thermarum]
MYKALRMLLKTWKELVLPGPYGSIGCSSLSDDFKEQVFKELAFEHLRRFQICGILAPGSTTGHQQLSFMFPNRADAIKPELMMKRLVLNKVQSPIHIQLLEDDHRIVFESTLKVQLLDGLGVIGVPCHGRSAILSRKAIGGSEIVKVEEVAVEDGHEDSGGRDNETEAEEKADSEPKVFINVQQEVVEDGRENSGGRDEDDREEGRDHEKETEAEEIERETEVLNEVEEVAEDGRENGGGRDGMIEDEHHEGGNEIRAYGPKIIQVFQPNRVPHFLASRPRFIHWRHERSAVPSGYEVNFGKEDEIQEFLRTGSHATILVLADTSKLTTVGMTFSFAGGE